MMWRASSGTRQLAKNPCDDPDVSIGSPLAFNTGLALIHGSTTGSGEDLEYHDRLTVKPKPPYHSYSGTCHTRPYHGGCNFDVSEWGAVAVYGGPDQIVRFDALGNRDRLAQGDYPSLSADGNSIAFQAGDQIKLWNHRTGAVTLVSVTSG